MVSLKKAAKHNSHRRCDVANRQPPCARSRAPSKAFWENQKKYRGARASDRSENAPRSPLASAGWGRTRRTSWWTPRSCRDRSRGSW